MLQIDASDRRSCFVYLNVSPNISEELDFFCVCFCVLSVSSYTKSDEIPEFLIYKQENNKTAALFLIFDACLEKVSMSESGIERAGRICLQEVDFFFSSPRFGKQASCAAVSLRMCLQRVS